MQKLASNSIRIFLQLEIEQSIHKLPKSLARLKPQSKQEGPKQKVAARKTKNLRGTKGLGTILFRYTVGTVDPLAKDSKVLHFSWYAKS